MTYRNVILLGDVRVRLREMPAESVHCVVTSPPYWGLRDYGTASWAGGNEGCAHRSPTMRAGRNEDRPKLGGSDSTNSAQLLLAARSRCGKCGAKRIDSQLGLEATPDEYVATMVDVFREVRRVLRRDGTCWVNLGDSYAAGATSPHKTERDPRAMQNNSGWTKREQGTAPTLVSGLKPKDLCGIPWRVALALQADGWWLRSDIIWAKPNPMPESVTDRPTKAHEYIFLLTKSAKYFYDAEAVRERTRRESSWDDYERADGHSMPSGTLAEGVNAGFGAKQDSLTHPAGRNARTVWTIATEAYAEAHFATYPTELVKKCIQAGTSEHGCCSTCGAPWRRVVERVLGPKPATMTPKSTGRLHEGLVSEKTGLHEPGWRDEPRAESRTTGWQPSCKHEAPVEPCLVLDCFGGAMTTALAALRAGRDFVMIELNPAYVAMGQKRIDPYLNRLL